MLAQDIELHGYHPHSIERTGLIESLMRQSREMGLRKPRAYSRARLGPPGHSTLFRKYQHRLAWR